MSNDVKVTQADRDLLEEIKETYWPMSSDDKALAAIANYRIRHQPQEREAVNWPQRLTELVADLETWEPHMIEALRATEPAKKLATALTTPAPAASRLEREVARIVARLLEAQVGNDEYGEDIIRAANILSRTATQPEREAVMEEALLRFESRFMYYADLHDEKMWDSSLSEAQRQVARDKRDRNLRYAAEARAALNTTPAPAVSTNETVATSGERYRPEIIPRASLRCTMGIHKFESYAMDPAMFECTRCGQKRNLR